MGFFNKVGHQIGKGFSALEERNRRQAQLNRIRAALRREERATQMEYISLGKYYYEKLRDPASDVAEAHCKELERIETRMNAAVKQLELCYAEISRKREKEIEEEEIFLEEVLCIDTEATHAAAEAVKNAAMQVGEKVKKAVADTQEAAKETAAEVEEKVLKAVEETAYAVAEAAAERRNIQPDEGLDDDSDPEESPAFATGAEEEEGTEESVVSADDKIKGESSAFAADPDENDHLPFAD